MIGLQVGRETNILTSVQILVSGRNMFSVSSF